MNLNREQAVFLQHIAELVRKAPEYGLTVTAGELYRTPEQQALYVANGRSKTMNSQHLKRLAVDLNFFTEEADGSLKLVYDGEGVRALGLFWESLDPANRWGGNWSNFKDMPHFERHEGSAGTTAGPWREQNRAPQPRPRLPLPICPPGAGSSSRAPWGRAVQTPPSTSNPSSGSSTWTTSGSA